MPRPDFVEEVDLRFPPEHPRYKNRRPKTEREKAQDAADEEREETTVVVPEEVPTVRVWGVLDTLQQELDDLHNRLDAIRRRVEELEARPGPQNPTSSPGGRP